MFNNMKATPLMNERQALDEESFVAIRVWRVPHPVRGSEHVFKYSLVLIVRDECVVRYDNEAGKGDHRHLGNREDAYSFSTPEQLIADFWADVDAWRASS
jgi:desulfoferrodoxin (superoxide reductase-like protein)